jgi:hypothetical protein
MQAQKLNDQQDLKRGKSRFLYRKIPLKVEYTIVP